MMNDAEEAASAHEGLPDSIWKTYSAFANTNGGVLLPADPEGNKTGAHEGMQVFIDRVRSAASDGSAVSVNILPVLSDSPVCGTDAGGKSCASVTVPRAARKDRPVYVGKDPYTGTYYRSADEDRLCTACDVEAMLRDAAAQTQDTAVLDGTDMSVLDGECVQRYRARMRECRPAHAWHELSDGDFLFRLGASGRGNDGKIYPTAAGLLMFGKWTHIKEQYAYFSLCRDSREVCENLYDFYVRTCGLLTGNARLRSALREALANCIVNADYNLPGGINIENKRGHFTFTNPGAFRIMPGDAAGGGVSDPRNALIMKMFNVINAVKQSGGGIPEIVRTCKMYGLEEPVITESFGPLRVTFAFSVKKMRENADGALIKPAGAPDTGAHKREMIIDFLSCRAYAKTSEIAAFVDLKRSRTRDYMSELVRSGVVISEGANKNRRYRLRSGQ